MHIFIEGVTVIVAVTVVRSLFTGLNAGISPDPLAGKPIDERLFVQLYTVLFTGPEKIVALVVDPLHTVWSAGCVTDGVGFTVIMKYLIIPSQPFVEGVTDIFADIGALLLLTAVKTGRFPVPEAASPMDGRSFVQLKTAPAALPVKLTSVDTEPLHIS